METLKTSLETEDVPSMLDVVKPAESQNQTRKMFVGDPSPIEVIALVVSIPLGFTFFGLLGGLFEGWKHYDVIRPLLILFGLAAVFGGPIMFVVVRTTRWGDRLRRRAGIQFGPPPLPSEPDFGKLGGLIRTLRKMPPRKRNQLILFSILGVGLLVCFAKCGGFDKQTSFDAPELIHQFSRDPVGFADRYAEIEVRVSGTLTHTDSSRMAYGFENSAAIMLRGTDNRTFAGENLVVVFRQTNGKQFSLEFLQFLKFAQDGELVVIKGKVRARKGNDNKHIVRIDDAELIYP